MYVAGDINRIAQEALLDAVAGPAFFVNPEYRYLAFNEANRRTVKVLYETDLEVGMSLLDAVTCPEDREVLKAHIDRALAGETHSSGSWYGNDPDSRYYYTITYSPVMREKRVVGVAAVAVEATDLLKAYEALHVLSDVVDACEDAISTWSADGTITSWNPGAERLTGYTASEMIGRRLDPLTAAGPQSGFPEAMTKVAAGVRVDHLATEMQRRDGTRVAVEMTVSPVFAEDGSVYGGTIVARDVEQKRSMTEALRRSEQKFEAAFRSSPDAININRLSDGMYLEVNEGFTSLTGYTVADVEGKTSLELSIWDDPADRARLVEGLRRDGYVDRLEARFRRKDGSVTVGEISARIIEAGGQSCILSVTRDISERKRAQADLEASYARLERMSHDMVQTLGRVVETRDPYTQGHEQRAAELCRLIGVEMGMSDSDVAFLETGALVHDIGKLSVPAEILTKPGRLSPVEYALIREHPRNSYEILKDIAFEWPIADMVLQHHERMDGSGYPDGLRGDEIDIHARVLAVADVVEAMATHRPYRPALGLEAAVEELRLHPELYDADVVTAFLAVCDGGCVKL
jgi:PAS domain S-box-containing protein